MTDEEDVASREKRQTGPRSYPVLTFENALELPKEINNQGVQGRIRRLTLFQQLGRSPGGGASRALIASSAKYGLTIGNYSSEFLELTSAGEVVSKQDAERDTETLKLMFQLAMLKTPVFRALYEKLKNKRIPAYGVLDDLLEPEGIGESDRQQVRSIFLENARFLGLVQEQAGGDYLIPLEQVLEDLSGQEESKQESDSTASEQEQVDEEPDITRPTTPRVDGPPLHINVQVHIDASATPEQIDQIFSSMARHLYRREG